jgi:putative oxidoreductase
MTNHGYAVDTGLLILRLCLGLTVAAHGYNKFFSGSPPQPDGSTASG